MKCACIYIKWKQESRTPSLRAYIHSLYNLQQQYNFEFTLGRSYIKLYVMCKCMFPHIYLHCMQLWTHKHTLHIRNSQDNHSSHPLLPTLIPHFMLWVESTGHSTLFHIRACTLLCISSAIIGIYFHTYEMYTRQWLRVLHWMNFIWWLGKCGTTLFSGVVRCRLVVLNKHKNNCMEFCREMLFHCIWLYNLLLTKVPIPS